MIFTAIFEKFGVLGYEHIREYHNERSATYQARERLVYGPGKDAGESAQRKCGGSMGGFYALLIVNLMNQENIGLLKNYDAKNVRFFGTSSGGGQALSLCMYIRHENLPVSLPGKLVLQSPGLQVPPSESQKTEMEKRKKADVMIPPGFFDNIASVLVTGDEAYLLSPILFDLTGFPPMDIFYGTEEVMIAYLPDMQAACKKYGVQLNTHIGKGMMHCWGAVEFVPEAKAVRQEYFKALK